MVAHAQISRQTLGKFFGRLYGKAGGGAVNAALLVAAYTPGFLTRAMMIAIIRSGFDDLFPDCDRWLIAGRHGLISVLWRMTQTHDGGLSDDPVYRAGVLTGRTQCVTDVMELILAPDGRDAGGKVRRLLEWCVQTQAEGTTELALVVADLHDGGG